MNRSCVLCEVKIIRKFKHWYNADVIHRLYAYVVNKKRMGDSNVPTNEILRNCERSFLQANERKWNSARVNISDYVCVFWL